MEQDQPPPPYNLDRKEATFAEVVLNVDRSTEFQEALAAFREFLAKQEQVTLSKDQLKILKSQSVYVLEVCAKHKQAGGDLSPVLPVLTEIFEDVTNQLDLKTKLETAIQDPNEVNKLESVIEGAFGKLATQLREMIKGEDAESTMYKNELERARENDRKRIEELETVIRQLPAPTQNLRDAVTSSMAQSLKVIGDPTVGLERVNAKRIVTILADMTGQALPPSTIHDKEFVTIGTHAIHQGLSYDIFKGEYSPEEEIAIKVLRHRVDRETARRTHERFARQAIYWSVLRHDSIIPFYGIGVVRSPAYESEFQMYIVSPYLKNQDVRRYLKKYNRTPTYTRLQMALGIAKGLKYMHAGPGLAEGQGLVHSALNIFNVLVKDSGRVVISGFGHTKPVIEGHLENFTGDNTEYRYMGPEMLDEAVLTYGSDIWSWAMTSLEILTDEPPFGQKTRGTKIIQLIAAEKRPVRAEHPKIEEYERSDQIWQLFEDCWRTKPQDRPTASELVQRLKALVHTSPKTSHPNHPSDPQISSTMTANEIIRILCRHGCQDITSRMAFDRCSQQPIAGGGFGDIYQGYLHNGLKTAIKRPRLYIHDHDDGRNVLKTAAKELYAWSKHNHTNVLTVLGLAEFQGQIAIVSPWMDNGTVMNYISQHADVDRRQLCMDIASGLTYLHQKGTAHGDMKGQNILISKEGIAKITDFGSTMLKQYTLGFTGVDPTGQFSLRWAAPELLKPEGRLSIQADVYALGMTMLEIITGQQPFDDILMNSAVFGAIVKGETPQRPSRCILEGTSDGDKLWQILKSCWEYEPNLRPSAGGVKSALSCSLDDASERSGIAVETNIDPLAQNALPWYQVFLT